MGDVYEKQENFEKAIDFYLKSIEINPNDVVVLNRIGNIYE